MEASEIVNVFFSFGVFAFILGANLMYLTNIQASRVSIQKILELPEYQRFLEPDFSPLLMGNI